MMHEQKWMLKKTIALGAGTLLAGTLFVCHAGEASSGMDWPCSRGNQALHGVSSTTLGTNLTQRWVYKTKDSIKSSPVVAQGRVFIGSDDKSLHAIDFASGKELWTFQTEAAIEAAPLVLGDRVYIGSTDNKVYALTLDGKLLWKFSTEGKIVGAPNWFKVPGKETPWLLVGSHDNKLYSINADTGASNWVFECSNFINATPAVSEGRTIFGGCDAILHVISLEQGKETKQIDGGSYIANSVALDGNFAFFGHMENVEFWCVDIQKETNAWTYKERSFPFASDPALTEDRVVIGGRDKRLHCINRQSGKQIWTFVTRGKVDSSPVICGDKVVVGSDDGRLYMVSLKDGKQLWSTEIGQPISCSPALASQCIIVGCHDGNVYCFGSK